MKLTLESTVSKSEELIQASLEESIALMSIENGRYYGLENVAKNIWLQLETPKQIQDIVKELQQQYEVEKDLCQSETLQFLETLWGKKMIEVVD